MELQRGSFTDVVLELARKYQLPVETLEGPQQERLRQQLSRREKLHRVLTLAAGWFQAQLRAPEGAAALGYLRDGRGLSEATLESFQLGYAPESWDGLLRHLQQVERLEPELLEAAGLVVPRKGGNGHYDRFRQRVMVPIRDRQGRVIGFGGRSLDGAEPKYLNSPETEVFEKGRHLFGLDRAADPIRRADQAVVVEGYFDVIALHASGITNAVAALGTALSRQQITQLCRCCDGRRLVLNFDSDGAGVRAAQRAIGEAEQLALQGVTGCDETLLAGVVEAQRERSKTLKEMATASLFFFREPVFDDKAVAKHLTSEALTLLAGLQAELTELADWSAPAIHNTLETFAAMHQLGLGKVAQPLRVALCGGTISPPIDATVALLGRERAMARLTAALQRQV
jgi:DNA primase catalytic core